MGKIFSILSDKHEVLITGGTGTLGKAVIGLLLKEGKSNITVLSRDELKQARLKKEYPQIKFVLGDIRDRDSLTKHFIGKDVVFHFAALKHVDIAEENPEESLKVNLGGTINVSKAAEEAFVSHVVFSSTDKAVLPINTYGMCKALSEKYLFHQNKVQDITRYSVFRWGNVLGSRGSVLHNFISSLKDRSSVSITDARMTRFWIDINDAAKFILNSYQNAPKDRALIPPMKASRIIKLAEMCARYLDIKDFKINYSGMRPGEKIHECVHSDHDVCIRSDNVMEYSDEELLQMIAEVAF